MDEHQDPTEKLSRQPTVELVNRARSGDRAAMEILYRRYLSRLQRWARGRLPQYTRGPLDTEDVVQKVLANSLRHIASFELDHSGAFQAYLRQGVLNSIRDEIRRQKRGPLVRESAGIVADPGPSPLEAAIGHEKLERYERALAGLKPAERESIVARFELGLSYKEIALELGKPSADAARVTVSRAICRLASRLRDQT